MYNKRFFFLVQEKSSFLTQTYQKLILIKTVSFFNPCIESTKFSVFFFFIRARYCNVVKKNNFSIVIYITYEIPSHEF